MKYIQQDRIVYICAKVPPDEALAQLAEEAAELAQAALKLRRAIDGTNPTPISEADAWESLHEEVADVLTVLELFDLNKGAKQSTVWRINSKLIRWEKRLRAREEGSA